jgi:hypothetical protein
LVDEAHVGPAINKTMFPNTKYGSYSTNWYWASGTYGSSAYGWAINFDDGFTGYNSGTATGKNGGPEWNYSPAPGSAACAEAGAHVALSPGGRPVMKLDICFQPACLQRSSCRLIAGGLRLFAKGLRPHRGS